MTHPKVGPSWEGLNSEEVLRSEPYHEADSSATHQGDGIRRVIRRGGHLLGVECKSTDVPGTTRSLCIATEDLGLDNVAAVYPGIERFPIWEIPKRFHSPICLTGIPS